jgi:hypothetical protein
VWLGKRGAADQTCHAVKQIVMLATFSCSRPPTYRDEIVQPEAELGEVDREFFPGGSNPGFANGYRPRNNVIEMEVICREFDLLTPLKLPSVFLAGKDSKEENGASNIF